MVHNEYHKNIYLLNKNLSRKSRVRDQSLWEKQKVGTDEWELCDDKKEKKKRFAETKEPDSGLEVGKSLL